MSAADPRDGAERPAPADAFAVYIHWPFCLSKCPYCDFNSHVRHAAIDEGRFVRAFTAEIAATAARVPGRTVSTIFFGGGTPSLMAPTVAGCISDGVPPPRKMLVTVRPGARAAVLAISLVKARRKRGSSIAAWRT